MDDPAQRERLEQLLMAELEAEDFFTASTPDVRLRLTGQGPAPVRDAVVIDEQIGSRIGPYLDTSPAGRGRQRATARIVFTRARQPLHFYSTQNSEERELKGLDR